MGSCTLHQWQLRYFQAISGRSCVLSSFPLWMVPRQRSYRSTAWVRHETREKTDRKRLRFCLRTCDIGSLVVGKLAALQRVEVMGLGCTERESCLELVWHLQNVVFGRRRGKKVGQQFFCLPCLLPALMHLVLAAKLIFILHSSCPVSFLFGKSSMAPSGLQDYVQVSLLVIWGSWEQELQRKAWFVGDRSFFSQLEPRALLRTVQPHITLCWALNH